MRKGYYCDEFLRIPNDFESVSSCREVLLAAGWFITNQNLFDKFIANSDCAFDYECAKDSALEVILFFSK